MKKQLFMAAAALLAGVSTTFAQPKIIAHRGYWKTAGSAENSLASFTKADAIGCYGSEMDVWLTADNRLIVNHDRVYRGTTIDMEHSRASLVTAIVLPNGENIPTLDAYLDLVAAKPATRLILEMKSLSTPGREEQAAAKIVKALKKHRLLARTDLIAFSLHACKTFRKLLPDSRIYYLNGDLTPAEVKALNFTGIDYSTGVLRNHPEWVKQAHEIGLEVNVWTVDSDEDMDFCIALGVDYITTNEPEKLAAKLR